MEHHGRQPREHGDEYPGTNMVNYPFPLRDGMTAHFVLPKDLTLSEVIRINKFLVAVTVDKD